VETWYTIYLIFFQHQFFLLTNSLKLYISKPNLTSCLIQEVLAGYFVFCRWEKISLVHNSIFRLRCRTLGKRI